MGRVTAGAVFSVLFALGCCASSGIASAADLGDEPSLSGELDLPFSRQSTARGIVTGSLADSLALAAIPAPAIDEAVKALATALDLDRDVRTGDRFDLGFDQVFALDGTPTGEGRLLWAELTTATRGTVAVHRFRPRTGAEQFWLAGGKAAGPAPIGPPLDTMTLTSGFGLRADPLDQPPGPLAHMARVSVPAAPPPPRAPTEEEKAQQVRDRREVTRAYAGFGVAQLGRAATAFGRNADLDRIMAERRIRARQQKEDAERAAREAAAEAARPRPVAVLAPGPPAEPPRLFMHEGLDLLATTGTPIHAAADGTVVAAGPNGGYGNWIRLQHAGRLTTVYGHLSKFAEGIAKGAEVKRGEVIGFVGSTGRSTGPHLHFELQVANTPVDPRTNPATKPDQLTGADLARFRKQMAASMAERDREPGAAEPNVSALSPAPASDPRCEAF